MKRCIWDTSDDQGMGALVTGYLEWLRFKGFSPETLRAWNHILWLFAQWLHERGVMRPREVTPAIIERYQRYLISYRKRDGGPISNRGIRGRLSPVRSFFRWLMRKHHLLSNPAADMELPKVGLRIPKQILSVKDVESVLSQPDLSTAIGLRDRAMLEVLYSTGIRRAELSRLKQLDVDMERETLLISEGKGMRDRLIPIGHRALLWVRRYLTEARPRLAVEPDEGYLFLTKEGTPFVPGSLSPLMAGYVKRSGIGKTGSCHIFRHTMATLMLEGGADIRYIQQMLGHARLESTETYTRVSMRKLRKVFQATHPAARVGRARAPDEELFTCLAAEEEDER